MRMRGAKDKLPEVVNQSSIAILATALLALSGLGPYMFDQLGVFMIDALTNGMTVEINPTSLYLHIGSWVLGYARIIVPIVALLVVAALGVNYAQVGVLFTLQPLTPKAERISPFSGIKRIFSSKGLVELAKSLFKIGAVVYVTYLTISADMNNLVAYMDMGVGQIFRWWNTSSRWPSGLCSCCC